MLVAGKERCIRCMHLLDEEGHCAKCEFDASSYKQPNMALPLGTCLNERYFLGKVLGEGGFGITYVAWDIVLMVPVAVKGEKSVSFYETAEYRLGARFLSGKPYGVHCDGICRRHKGA